jgi:hypothetical protein
MTAVVERSVDRHPSQPRKVVAHHFYGHAGDPGFSGGPCTERVFYGSHAWERAARWATDWITHPTDDWPHPGRVMVRDVTPVWPRRTELVLWIGPDVEVSGGFAWQWREVTS